MKRNILFCLLVLLTIQTVVSATVFYVPSRDYETIESAIDDAVSDDTILVAPGTYTPPANGYDFDGDSIILKSWINPDNPDPNIIAATIIDCGGQPDASPAGDAGAANRAFWFHNAEDSNSKVIGFTIINGYARGRKGADGELGYIGDPVNLFKHIAFCDDQLECPPYALDGADAFGSGYGGAILCQDASPTIQYCVISNCTVTGAHGGRGADGLDGVWEHWTISDFNEITGMRNDDAETEENSDGQWGGSGGIGSGNGYGGAIACLGGSSPLISDCTISDNFARGGCGGPGGNGGNAEEPPDYDKGDGSFGGDANDSIGDGIGGGIYCEGTSTPTVVNCTFSNNIATTGARAVGGLPGQGNAISEDDGGPATKGWEGFVWGMGGIAGGAVYHDNVDADYTKCDFTANQACEEDNCSYFMTWQASFAYTIGGALYSTGGVNVNLDSCKFVNNMGGAVYCGSNTTLNINNTTDPNTPCLFTNNSDLNDGDDLLWPMVGDLGSGGAIYLDTGCIDVDIQNSIFSGNTSKNDGGAIKSESDIATLKNCSFGNNQSGRYGGAIDLYTWNDTLAIDANNCSFYGNQSEDGGAFSAYDFTANITASYFINNTALSNGGALDLWNGNITISDSTISENTMTGTGDSYGAGGGIDCSSTTMTMQHCTVQNNTAEGVNATGGAINLHGGSGGIQHVIQNCLITGNYAGSDGGAIACIESTAPDVNNCTFSDNSTGGFGGAIFADYLSNPTITNGIFNNCNSHAIHEEDGGGDATVTYSLFYNNPDGDYYDSVAGLAGVGAIPGGSNNLDGDPLFFGGPFGSYYLMQTATGDPNQFTDSPAVDAGKTVSGWDPCTYTTRTDSVGDSGPVDMGYHYPFVTDVDTFELVINVACGNGEIGIISPAPLSNPAPGVYTFYEGTVVTLEAMPDAGWRIGSWIGSDDDSSDDTINTVVMNCDRYVSIEFYWPRTLIVSVGGGGEGYFANIQDAIHNANDGDVIIVYPGTYFGPGIQVNKSVEIKSLHPDDPNWVDTTIIDRTDYGNRAFEFQAGSEGVIINGLTIQNCRWIVLDGHNALKVGLHGEDGYGADGAAIYICAGMSPTFKNCVFRDNWIRGGHGGNGANADAAYHAGRGGWGAYARGGAIYCGQESNVEFVNCQIIDNTAIGGNGGDGGNWEATSGNLPNYGGNWSRAEWWNVQPTGVSWESGDLWQVWQMHWVSIDGQNGGPRGSYMGNYRWYTGYGGSVFCDANSTVTFTHCTIQGNLAQGGMSGLGGEWPAENPEPEISYELPSFGGGVYCAAGSTVTFEDCNLLDNMATDPTFDHSLEDDELGDDYDPNDKYRIDPYVGHGGGVCAEDTATVIFTCCNVRDNEASVGGGINFANANPVISDCNIAQNQAYHGGGIFGQDGSADIINSIITGNLAFIEPNNPNDIPIFGNGGGIHLWATNANIFNCFINRNEAVASGGGIYFGGESTPSMTNCLITENTAGRDGAAVSTNIFTQLTISNCTIADNNTVGSPEFSNHYGGGLSCSYGSYTEIINSIIWGNAIVDQAGITDPAGKGQQIAIGTGFEFDPVPSTVEVTYSDVDGGDSDVWLETDCILDWDNNTDADPLFVGGLLGSYYLQQPTSLDATIIPSPAVDTGSILAALLGMDNYTTSIEGSFDANTVDMGYHYTAGGSLPVYELQLSVIDGSGTVTPTTGLLIGGVYKYFEGTRVELQAAPDVGWRVESWSGTENDSSVLTTNYVVMNADKTVEIKFELPRTITVPGQYSSIQQAFDAAGEGDTILVGTGTYITSNSYVIQDKVVTITSENPDDPNVVAATVIELEVGDSGGAGRAFTFTNVGLDTVLNGITIRGFSRYGINGENGTGSGSGGRNGINIYGGAILCRAASPTIKNCVILDCNITGGDGGDGADGAGTDPNNPDPNFDGGHGGWPGLAYGGGLACMAKRNTDGTISPSNPAVINCTFRNNSVIGGNGGNGGDGADPDGAGGLGGGWYYSGQVDWEYGYHVIDAWFGLEGDGQYDFYTRYSGLGGAVYVGQQCAPTFNNCTFNNNSAHGGTCGIRGINEWSGLRDEPSLNWKIDNFGGAVYCDTNSVVEFTDCDFTDNVADINYPADNDDPYVSLGGAVAFQDGADVMFNNCSFNDNLATLGGALYADNSNLEISDSNFTSNTAYSGGGLYCVEADAIITLSNISRNNSSSDVNDSNTVILGNGAGIFLNSSDAQVSDCTIIGNYAEKSGGGVYIDAGSDSELFNCLIVDNGAGNDGGAVSVNRDSKAAVSHCTIVNNEATGFYNTISGTGYGGGLFCGYDSNTTVIDSIIWGNYAFEEGPEIAIGSNSGFDESIVNVSYSDVLGSQGLVYIGTDCTLVWGPGNLNTDPLFVSGPSGDHYLSQTATEKPEQTTTSPCVDAGSDLASEIGFDSGYTTRTDEVHDALDVDMGYHYPINEDDKCKLCDLSQDGIVNISDLQDFVLHWLETGCSAANNFCSGADFNFDAIVNLADFAKFADCWLVADTNPPYPNPAEWQVEPYAVSQSSIAMIAKKAFDIWSNNVYYYYECVSGACNDSGWLSNDPNYEDTGLAPDTVFGYRVKVGDDFGNETDFSTIKYVQSSPDTEPPITDPGANEPEKYTSTWDSPPTAISSSLISMTVTAASDSSGVEYYFKCTAGGADPNFHDSGWQDSTEYIAMTLQPDTEYTFRVRARDKSPLQNSGYYSIEASATTWLETADNNAPSPAPIIDSYMYYEDAGSSYHQITVDVTAVNDDITPRNELEINFICEHNGSRSSGWVSMLGSDPEGTPSGTVTYNGNIVTYDAFVSSTINGPTYNWHVCVRDASQQEVCTGTVEIGPW